MTRTANRQIAIYLPPDSLGMSALLIKNLLWIASQYASKIGLDEEQSPLQTSAIRCFSIDGRPVSEFSGGHLEVDCALDDLGSPDTVFLSAFWSQVDECLEHSAPLLERLQQWHTQGVPIAGVSNAPYFMAEAGLLNDKVATIYPPASNDFQARYPDIELLSSRAMTDAGNLYCANGIASGCDLIVSIIEILFGPEVARRMNQEFLLGFQRNYQIANLVFDGQKYHSDPQILTAQHWLERNYQEEISIEVLAADRGMSPRNFSRRFKQATGDSPSHYLQRVRLEMAKQLLINSDRQITEIAYQVGYNDSNYFSRVFKQQLDCLPNQYRQQSKL